MSEVLLQLVYKAGVGGGVRNNLVGFSEETLQKISFD